MGKQPETATLCSPITNKEPLVEQGQVGAEKAVHSSSILAEVEYLTSCLLISVYSGR